MEAIVSGLWQRFRRAGQILGDFIAEGTAAFYVDFILEQFGGARRNLCFASRTVRKLAPSEVCNTNASNYDDWQYSDDYLRWAAARG